MVHTIDMPAALPAASRTSISSNGTTASTGKTLDPRHSFEQPAGAPDAQTGAWSHYSGVSPNGTVKEGIGGKDGSVLSVPNGGVNSERAPSAKSVALSTRSRWSAGVDGERRSLDMAYRIGAAEEGYLQTASNKASGPPRSPKSRTANGEPTTPTSNRLVSMTHGGPSTTTLPPVQESGSNSPSPAEGMLKPPHTHPHRASSPPAFNPSSSGLAVTPRPDRLTHRHTLEVPKVTSRQSHESTTSPTLAVDAAGKLSPTSRRRHSLQLGRRVTRSITSHDIPLDDAPQDEDAVRWAEHIRAKRASKRARADTDDERVMVGTKVDENHQNFVRAYNMLTGIRCCVSRINAKLDRELTPADFEAKHKYSFDITGSELTPSAKYDFKFKDYAPWVFRHLRTAFGLDPAEYLVSLTSKYILSELGSPGKSGSFFYFSRDYKYIIKTIHHGEHKFLRKILREYHDHVVANPNTLLSQFYGLHRVKMPYGKKVHFVVMNNLFPPHRDIHRTFDLKGSTIGRDFREEDLEKNPRATLKDLNWLRRNLHLEFGPTKKDVFVEQMQKDVALLKRLKIMDYSLLVGIHDLERGNEENLRDKTLQIFQPGGDQPDEPVLAKLTRTPSKLETAKRARELRATVNKERPIPISQSNNRMPEVPDKRSSYFYADDGGFQATHEDDTPGEQIYYLGIIDCLTRYNTLKRAEHFWKGMGGHESQISPIPPERYGGRFIRFIAGVTKSREQAEREQLSNTLEAATGVVVPAAVEGTIEDPVLSSNNRVHQDASDPVGTERVMQKAEHEAEKSIDHGASEEDVPDRHMTAVRSPGIPSEASTLPVIGEAVEGGLGLGRTNSSFQGHDGSRAQTLPAFSSTHNSNDNRSEHPPPTPPKDAPYDGSREFDRMSQSIDSTGRPPPTPPKDDFRGRFEKALPLSPISTHIFTASPSRLSDNELERARQLTEVSER